MEISQEVRERLEAPPIRPPYEIPSSLFRRTNPVTAKVIYENKSCNVLDIIESSFGALEALLNSKQDTPAERREKLMRILEDASRCGIRVEPETKYRSWSLEILENYLVDLRKAVYSNITARVAALPPNFGTDPRERREVQGLLF